MQTMKQFLRFRPQKFGQLFLYLIGVIFIGKLLISPSVTQLLLASPATTANEMHTEQRILIGQSKNVVPKEENFVPIGKDSEEEYSIRKKEKKLEKREINKKNVFERIDQAVLEGQDNPAPGGGGKLENPPENEQKQLNQIDVQENINKYMPQNKKVELNVIQQAQPIQYPINNEADKESMSSLDLLINKTYPLIINNQFIPMRRIVHLDLKGAPPKVNYLQLMFPVIKSLGATGILIEWEDMFPFKGPLAVAKNGYAYSEDEIQTILRSASEAGLEIIPLVQTFGHLEYILKLEQFSHLREDKRYSQVLCIGDDEAWGLIQTAIDEVIEAHKPFGLPYFHMGADEAFQIGQCQKDAGLMSSEGGRHNLILWHIARVAAYVRSKHKVRVLAWHDMFSGTDEDDLNKYNMPKLVEPVVWAYPENLDHFLQSSMWQKLQPFPNIWGASSFKGADGPSRYWSNPPRYLNNQLSWLSQMNRYHKGFTQFRGLILTGWSRYDHFALMGNEICELVNRLKTAKQSLSSLYSDYQTEGWLSRSSIVSHFASSWLLDKIESKVNMHHQRFIDIRDGLEVELSKYFYPDMVNEFVYQYVTPELSKLNDEKNLVDEIKSKNSFPVRPFKEFEKRVE